jgi:hypothetical protein
LISDVVGIYSIKDGERFRLSTGVEDLRALLLRNKEGFTRRNRWMIQ